MKKKWMTVFMACVMVAGSMGMYATAWGAEKPLDDTTKAAYYAEYQKIVAEVAAETETDISLLPMEEFTEKDWMAPKEYRELITAIANCDMRCESECIPATEYEGEMAQVVIDQHNVANQNSQKDNTTLLGEKQVDIEEQGYHSLISVSGTFMTQYNAFTDRQEFSGLQEISSISNDQAKWIQKGYEYQFIDCGRTCVVTLFGDLEIAGVAFPKLQTVEFYCSSDGAVE